MKNQRPVQIVQPLFKNPLDVLTFFKLNLPVLFLIFFLCVLGYGNALNGRFLSADDLTTIARNESIKDFGSTVRTLSLPTIISSAFINIFGINPVPFHIMSLVLHIINSWLVLLLTYMLLGKRHALYSALIFSVLPSGSEAVFWISGKGYVFQALFALLSINAFFLYKELRDRRFLIGSAVIYLLSLIFLQTPWMLTVPFIVFSLELHKSGYLKSKLSESVKKIAKNGLWDYGAFVLISLLYWVLWFSGQFSRRVTSLVEDFYSLSYQQTPWLAHLPYTVYKTVELYLVPLRLSFFQEDALTQNMYFFMILATAVTFGVLIYMTIRRSYYIPFIFAIISSVLPTMSPVQVAWFAAERYLYLGGAFFGMIVASLIINAEKRYRIQNLAPVTLVILLSLYTVRLITRSNDFQNSKSLWLATQKTAQYSYRVYNNLGDVYSSEQNWEAAINSFTIAIRLAPNYYDAIHNLGYTYMLMGDLENAKKYLLQAYGVNNRLYPALEKLGQIEYAQGNIDKAREYFQMAKQLNPELQLPVI